MLERELNDHSLTVRSLIDRLSELRGMETFLISPESGRSLSFADMKERANRLSDRLANFGLTTSDKVAFLLDNGIFTAELFLSIMYCGWVAVPLNVTAGKSALAQTIVDSDTTVVFVCDNYLDLLNEVRKEVDRDLRVVVYNEETEAGYTKSSCNAALQFPVEAPECSEQNGAPSSPRRNSDVSADGDALLAYTSGSTGRPKGAMFSHKNVLIGGYNTVVAHDLSPNDRSLCVLPLYHMNAQIVTLMSTLISGGSVVVPRHFNVDSFWHWVTQYKATWFALVPTIVSQLLQRADSGATSNKTKLDHVRFARCSSAPLSTTAHRQFEEQFDLPMIEAMGMTEAGGAIFSNPLPPHPRKIGSPGIPYGFEVKIIDQEKRPLPAGETGEILIAGGSVMKRYYKQPGSENTWVLPGFLSTGDLGWQDQDGFVFIVGRKSDVIQKGGEKIAPREIEELLLRHPAVLEAAVVGVADRLWGQDAVAYVALKPGQDCSADVLSRLCQRELGALKTPSRFHFLAELPKGTAHKINRTALAALAAAAASEHPASSPKIGTSSQAATRNLGYEAPRTPFECIIAEIWARELKQEKVGIHDDFFYIGGTSLLAMAIAVQLRNEFGTDISLHSFFEHPTIEQQALLIVSQLLELEPQLGLELEPSQFTNSPVASVTTSGHHIELPSTGPVTK
jgi:acyl-CoA synthetase (AMP-forming)/AMP-acid ligase II